MGRYLIYDNINGSDTARPVVGWGECPNGQEAEQGFAPGETSVATTEVLTEGSIYTYDTVAQTVTGSSAAAEPVTELEARRKIKAILDGSVWTQLPDAPLTTAEVQEWADYRAALRNLPTKPGWPDTVVWPTLDPATTTTEF